MLFALNQIQKLIHSCRMLVNKKLLSNWKFSVQSTYLPNMTASASLLRMYESMSSSTCLILAQVLLYIVVPESAMVWVTKTSILSPGLGSILTLTTVKSAFHKVLRQIRLVATPETSFAEIWPICRPSNVSQSLRKSTVVWPNDSLVLFIWVKTRFGIPVKICIRWANQVMGNSHFQTQKSWLKIWGFGLTRIDMTKKLLGAHSAWHQGVFWLDHPNTKESFGRIITL